jgi:hypothetical protein
MQKIIFMLCLLSTVEVFGQKDKIKEVILHTTELQSVLTSAKPFNYIAFKKDDFEKLELRPDSSFLTNKNFVYDDWYSTVYPGHKYLFEKQFGIFPVYLLESKLDSLRRTDCDFNWFEGRIYPDHIYIKVTSSCPNKNRNRVFQKVENNPGFFGGPAAFQQLVQSRLQCTDYKSFIQEDSAFFFTVLVKRDSMVHDVKLIDSVHSPLRKLIQKALINTYGWKSAFQGGRNVNGYLQVFIYIRKDGSIEADYYR